MVCARSRLPYFRDLCYELLCYATPVVTDFIVLRDDDTKSSAATKKHPTATDVAIVVNPVSYIPSLPRGVSSI